jgi:uncharacterized protein YndB with AHSA1/START domain
MIAMTDTITPTELRFERLLDADVATVWRWITDPELRARWFMGGPIDARPGGRITFTMAHDNLSDGPVPTPERYAGRAGHSWSETVHTADAPHRISFGWNEGKDGTVTIALTPEGERTRLVLTHAGIATPANARNFGGGWASHLAVLEARIAGRPVANFWALHAEAEARAAEALG